MKAMITAKPCPYWQDSISSQMNEQIAQELHAMTFSGKLLVV